VSAADSASSPVRSAEPAAAAAGRISGWRVLTAIGLLGCLPTLGALGARRLWMLELFVHFRAYYAGAFLLAAIVYALARRWRLAAVWTVFGAWNAAGIVPLYLSDRVERPRRAPAGAGQAAAPTGTPFKILSANVHTQNHEYRRLIDLVEREQPDLVIAIEVDDGWTTALQALNARYRSRRAVPRRDNFGMAVYSVSPSARMEARRIGQANVPSIVTRVEIASQPFTVIATHPLPPVSAEYAGLRNEQLAAVARYVQTIDGPVVVAGDLNTTPWSPYFQDLLRDGQLLDGRRGFGIRPTWDGGRIIVRLPIDHVLVPPEIAIEEWRVGDDIGSDHRPVIVTLRRR
jgi:endonuclease/exonuclease/phosphatase (EEP) superfamily protein YafD